MTTCLVKDLFICFTLRVLCAPLSIYECASFPLVLRSNVGFDLLVPDYRLSINN